MTNEIGWYKETQKPLRRRPGVYRTRFKGSYQGFSYFDGEKWGNQGTTEKLAVYRWKLWGTVHAIQSKEWCGLAERAQ